MARVFSIAEGPFQRVEGCARPPRGLIAAVALIVTREGGVRIRQWTARMSGPS
jgi:hypothetical protein